MGQDGDAKKILVVDDEEDIRKTVVFQFKNLGYEVITAADGKEALEKARSESPDLIISDLINKVESLIKKKE